MNDTVRREEVSTSHIIHNNKIIKSKLREENAVTRQDTYPAGGDERDGHGFGGGGGRRNNVYPILVGGGLT